MFPTVMLGPVAVATHDVFSVLALAVGFAIYYRELRRRGWLGGPIVWISLAAVLGGAIGARVITSWEHLEVYGALASQPFSEVIEHSGKSILGALAGGYLAIVLSKRAFGYTRSTGDCYLLAIPVATVIGRIGCFLSELPLGTPTDLPWGISVSPATAAAFARCPGCDVPMHPSMLYEIAFNLVAIVVILRYRDRVAVPGDAVKLYLLAAGGLPLPRRVRARQRAAGARPDGAAMGPHPDGRPPRAAFRPPGPARCLPHPRAANAHRRSDGGSLMTDTGTPADPSEQPAPGTTGSRADPARRMLRDRDRASSSSPPGWRRSGRASRTRPSSDRRWPAGSRPTKWPRRS